MDAHHYLASGGGVVGLIAYVVCNRIARRTPEFQGGSKILSWVGFFAPCIAWIVLFQGYTALDRAIAQSASAENRDNKASYVKWLVVYVIAVLVASSVAAR